MMMESLSPDEQGAIAYLIEKARQRTSYPQWDRPGIVTVIRKIHDDPARTLAAGYSAALDSTALTPSAITWPRHWPTQRRTHSPDWISDDPDYCLICSRTQHACERAESLVPPEGRHDFTSPAAVQLVTKPDTLRRSTT